jgi:hypothetical protein
VTTAALFRDEDVLLADIAGAARAAVLRDYTETSCILTTRVIIETCRYFGIAARPQAVTVQAFNPQAWDLAQRKVPLADWPPEAHSLGIIRRSPVAAGVWNGHLVAVTDSPPFLLDGSLDQASRPKAGIDLRPLVVQLPDGGMAPAGQQLRFTRHDGVVIIYEKLDDPSWRTSRNWRRRAPEVRDVTGRAVRAVKHAQEEKAAGRLADKIATLAVLWAGGDPARLAEAEEILAATPVLEPA